MKTREIFRCTDCGGQSPRWQGQCPSCGAWNTLKPQSVTRKGARPVRETSGESGPQPLAGVSIEGFDARTSGIPALDTVLGNGLVPGGAVLLGGEPGIGKSTLLLQLCGRQAEIGNRAVYLTGEESLAQLKSRAERLGCASGNHQDGLLALASTRVEDGLDVLTGPKPPDLMVVDSVQTLASPNADGIPGSVSQVRAVSGELVEAAKRSSTTLILVGHVTKEGQIAGPKLLEHMVDTVLYLEGDRSHFSRILRVLKNRFGPSDELLVFVMEPGGLKVVEDPSTMFLGEREAGLPGTALALALEGQRPFVVEVQALASKSFLSIPRRTALGMDTNRLNLLLAVMEKRLRVDLSQFDIYAKLAGGMAMRDPGLDLALVASTLSSYYDRPLPEGAVFWGEVDLNGQVRPVAGQDIRMKQAGRLGHKPIFEPQGCRTLTDLQAGLFGKGRG